MNIAQASRPTRGPHRPPAAETAEHDGPQGCGWFDSSFELRAGLCVTEHDSPDRVANDLALDVWLAWHLAGHGGPATAAQACASSGV